MNILRRLTGKPKGRQFAVIDIESRAWVEPYAVGFYDGTKYATWTDYTFSYLSIDKALRHVLTPDYAGWWIYAHNGGNFDFTFFLRHLMLEPWFRKRFFVEITPVGSTIVRFDVIERNSGLHAAECVDPRCKGCDKTNPDGKRRMRWTFVDSVRLMPLPLNEVGEAFGLGRKVDLKISYDELAKPTNEPTMAHYLEVDCKLLHSALVKMQVVVNDLGGQLGVTLPATALDLFRRKFLKDDIHTSRHSAVCPEFEEEHKSKAKDACQGCLHQLFRDAYFGGRTEIFTMRFEPYVNSKGETISTGDMYDFSSHYAACMLEPMPTGSATECEGLSEEDIFANAKRGYIGIVECDVEIPDSCYLPPLPYRKDKKSKLTFPTGKLSGTWDTAELLLLPKVGGRIVRSRRSVWFETSPVFTRYVRQLYKFRDKTSAGWNQALDWIAKLFLNSLYGKFAMVEDRTRIILNPDSPEGLRCISLDADAWLENVHLSPNYVIPQLSVHVTSVARAKLWERLFDVIARGGRLYYTDTDSIACAGVKLATGKGLGDFKHEGSFNRAEFVLPKLYMMEMTGPVGKKKTKEQNINIKAKGMGPGIRVAKEENEPMGDDPFGGQLSEEEFVSMVRNGVPLERSRLSKLREGLAEYARTRTLFPRVITAPKSIKTSYDKRRIGKNGETTPLRVDCWS